MKDARLGFLFVVSGMVAGASIAVLALLPNLEVRGTYEFEAEIEGVEHDIGDNEVEAYVWKRWRKDSCWIYAPADSAEGQLLRDSVGRSAHVRVDIK